MNPLIAIITLLPLPLLAEITLSETQQKNLGLQTEEAAIIEMAPAVEVPAVLIVPPDKRAAITAPFEGRVNQVLVKIGDEVSANQPILRVTPRTVGSPAQELKAPLAGKIYDLPAITGTAFTAETVLAQTGDSSEMLARASVWQTPEMARIKPGKNATLRVDIFPTETFPAKVLSIDPGHEEASPFFHVYAALPNPDHRLHANYRAWLTIETGDQESVIAVPERAVLGTLGKQFLFVETEPGHYERRDVVTGLRSAGRIEIREGVMPGDRVVTVGNYQLQFAASEEGSAIDPHAGHSH